MTDSPLTHPDALTMGSCGKWSIQTRDSIHILDLDLFTATRMPGPTANEFAAVVAKPLLDIDLCQLGEPGRWMIDAADDSAFDFYWVLTSRVMSIKPVEDE
jgi:hypothetical protein